jgi:hypothetical protein
MRQATSRSPVQRIAAGLLLAALCVPAPVWAADEPAEEVSEGPPAPVEAHWYDRPLQQLDIVVDLLVIRPCALVTAATGAALFVPAVILSAPNGKDSMTEAYDRFVREPGEYFASRPLGEF